MKKFIIFISLTAFWIVILLPKEEIWNDMNYYMNSKNISLKSEKIKDLGYMLKIKDIRLFLEKLFIAKADEIKIKPWIFYNEAIIKNINIPKKLLEERVKISELKISHKITNPLNLYLKGGSEYGNFDAIINLKEKKITIRSKDKKFVNLILKRFFTKEKNGNGYEFKY